jgi:uncharacterized RDD family membrane protein YckC
MKCPKCGYHSFDHLESCRKCGRDLGEHKARFGLTGVSRPRRPVAVAPPPAIPEPLSGDVTASAEAGAATAFSAEAELPPPAAAGEQPPEEGLPPAAATTAPCAVQPEALPPAAAPLGRRLAATAVDLLVLALILALFAAAAAGALLLRGSREEVAAVEVLLDLSIPCFLLLFTLTFGYFTLFHFLLGQTPGKMLCRLRVEGEDGAGLFLSQAFLRSVGGLLSLAAGGVGYLRIPFDRQGRGWSDLLAGSRVVFAEAPEEEAGE